MSPFNRTYLPNKISYVLELWRAEVDKVNKKVGQSLADPEKYDNLFPGFHDSIKTQQYLLKENNLLPAHQASQVNKNSFYSRINDNAWPFLLGPS